MAKENRVTQAIIDVVTRLTAEKRMTAAGIRVETGITPDDRRLTAAGIRIESQITDRIRMTGACIMVEWVPPGTLYYDVTQVI